MSLVKPRLRLAAAQRTEAQRVTDASEKREQSCATSWPLLPFARLVPLDRSASRGTPSPEHRGRVPTSRAVLAGARHTQACTQFGVADNRMTLLQCGVQ